MVLQEHMEHMEWMVPKLHVEQLEYVEQLEHMEWMVPTEHVE